jgi:hypothetical protein
MNALRILALLGLAPSVAVAQPLQRPHPGPIELMKRHLPPAQMAAVEAIPTFNGESAKMFATRVQPVLNNLCANCHARADVQTAFKLKRVEEGYANPQAAEFNIRAAAKQLNRTTPAGSALLVKAVTAHGPAKEPPLRGKQLPPYKVLELWAHWAVLPEGSPMPTSLTPAVTRTAQAMPGGTSEFASGTELSPFAQPPAKPTEPPPAIVPVGTIVQHLSITKPEGVPALPMAPANEEPAKLPESVRTPSEDPFDPDQFNKYAHPQRK